MIWGADGPASGAVAIALVAVNLLLAALGLSWAAKVSLTTIMAMALGGFAVRMGLVCAVLFAVRDASWIDLTALGVTVLVTHLGLLFWELRFVSASLAFPGLKPTSLTRRPSSRDPRVGVPAHLPRRGVAHPVRQRPVRREQGRHPHVGVRRASPFAVMYLGGRKRALVPTGMQNVAESAVDFVEDGIVMQTIGPDGLKFTPFLLTLFTFVLTCNIWGLIPGVQMPVNARIALPMFMALLVYVIYHVVGDHQAGADQVHQGHHVHAGRAEGDVHPAHADRAGHEVHHPAAVSMAVRLFANMLAGHLLLVSFAVITGAVFRRPPTSVIFPFSFGLLVFLSTFEILVAFLQAYIFTILAAVYIADAMHPAH